MASAGKGGTITKDVFSDTTALKDFGVGKHIKSDVPFADFACVFRFFLRGGGICCGTRVDE